MTGASTARVRRPTVAVWKFASCDGCQLTVLDGEEDLLTVAGAVRFAHFRELSSRTDPGPYDLSLVEGSIASRTDAERIRQIRQLSRRLVAIGACATAGGIQSLRNFAADGAYPPLVYAHPEYLDSLDTVTPISAHVDVDLELNGCPIDPGQLLDAVTATLAGRKAVLPGGSVCQQCKAAGTVSLTVSYDVVCLDPATPA